MIVIVLIYTFCLAWASLKSVLYPALIANQPPPVRPTARLTDLAAPQLWTRCVSLLGECLGLRLFKFFHRVAIRLGGGGGGALQSNQVIYVP